MHKPYPWTCGICTTKTVNPVVLPESTIERLYQGKIYVLTIQNYKTQVCDTCKTEWTSIEQCDAWSEALQLKLQETNNEQ